MEGVCPERKDCPYYERGCKEDTHHLFYPKSAYRTPIERVFRGLPENQVEICRAEHDEIHATEPEPVKPSLEVMEHTIIASGVHLSVKARKALRHAT